MADGLRRENVGRTVQETLSECDTTVAASFTSFVESRSEPKKWFTFLCDGQTVMAMATCKVTTQARPAMRRLRQRLSDALQHYSLWQDKGDERFFVLMNSDHSIQAMSSNAPSGHALTEVLYGLAHAHKKLELTAQCVAWVSGYMVEFQPMNHSTVTTTLATLHPVGLATVPQLAQLTPAQAQIVRFAANGSTAPEIARSLNRSIETIRTHLRAAYRGLHVCSRVELLPSADELAQWGAV
ncbi:MAG: DNA-binding CsgD family transcriptional regulator [Myxococcota bacterium]|jgi:DNA-binding CsgD family transcriptional regulator